MKQTVLIFSKSWTARDPRVRKQVEFLSRQYHITSLGYGEFEYPGVEHVSLSKQLQGSRDKTLYGKILRAVSERRLLETLFSRITRYIPPRVPFVHTVFKDFLVHHGGAALMLRKVIRRKRYDLILANDFSALSPCVWAAKGGKVLYDAHEYTLGQATNNKRWMKEQFPYIKYALTKYLPRCTLVTTVSDGIADEYANVFGIPRPEVIRNAAVFIDQRPSKVEHERVRIVHHGVAARQRSLESMIEAVLGSDNRFELDLYLVVKDADYYSRLKMLAGSDSRIHFKEPVAMNQISRTLNHYDAGIHMLPPSNFNHIHALPNKIFEYIQARLAIVVAPSPEMARLVRTYDLGVVAENYSVQSMIKTLNSLSSSKIARYKRNCDQYALELSAESEIGRLKNILNKIMNPL